jgi:hypothetical protein
MPRKTARIPGAPRTVPGGPRSIPGSGPRGGVRGGKYDINLPGVTWAGLDRMAAEMEGVGEAVHKARKVAAERLGNKMYAYATFNAPWKDRTLDARLKLRHRVVHDDSNHRSTIILAHGVEYGIHLESMKGGEFAIIMPTIVKFAAEVGGEIRVAL